MVEAGVRELRNNLSAFLDRVRGGEEVVVTDRGTPVARLVPMGRESAWDELVRDGAIQVATSTGSRSRPKRAKADGTVSDLVADQRR